MLACLDNPSCHVACVYLLLLINGGIACQELCSFNAVGSTVGDTSSHSLNGSASWDESQLQLQQQQGLSTASDTNLRCAC